MARYIDADIEVSDYVTVWDCDCSEFGRQTVMSVDDLQYLPTADVVPKSEVDELVQDGTRLEQENETLKDNNEHLAVMLEETRIELEAMRGAANSLKMHYEKAMEVHREVYRLASEIKAELPCARAELAKNVAREIFEEIQSVCLTHIDRYNRYIMHCEDFFELKKKYIGGNDDRL